MKVTGTTKLPAPVGAVYAALRQPEVLARTIPGCQHLELVGEDAYRMTVGVGVATIRGLYHADVQLLCGAGAPYTFALRASGAGLPGDFEADVGIVLADAQSGATALSYSARVTVGGVAGALGSFILTRAAKKSADEFFRGLHRFLSASKEAEFVRHPA